MLATDVLRLPALRWFLTTRLCMMMAMQILSVSVGWQVYTTTGRVLDLGLVGLVQFLPLLVLFPWAGAVVDRSDRRRVLMAVAANGVVVSLLLSALSSSDTVTPVFAALVLLSMGRVFAGPASSATLPRLVSTDDLPRAASLSSLTFSVATVLGPALGGGAWAAWGPYGAYGLAAVLMATALGCASRLPEVRPTAIVASPDRAQELLAGLRFIRGQPILLSAITLDLFAVLFGGAVALLPVYARDILHAGPETLGLLRAAPAVGAGLTALGLAVRPIRRNVGRNLLIAVAGFGAATVLFALSTEVWLSLLALALIGATDAISVYARQNIVALATPDAVRGRVSAVEYVFIGASNELGELESGLAAAAIGPVAAAAAGGLASIAVVAGCAVLAPQLRDLDRFEDLLPDTHARPAA
jgi:MFS family permease